MELVANKMKDPSSVKFRDVNVYLDHRLVCGQVNAKNSFGAYAGYTRFYASFQLPDGSVYMDGEEAEALPTYEEMCHPAAQGERIVPSLKYSQRLVDGLPESTTKDRLRREMEENSRDQTGLTP